MYNKLIIIFLIFIIILFFSQVKYETFQAKNVFDGNKNLYVEKNDNYNFDTINVNKLCIQEDDGTIECITKEQLFNALELPKFRRHSVCIDDACISKPNIDILKGDTKARFKAKNLILDNKEQCISDSSIEATPSVRKKWRWESDRYYDSVYEPDSGWEGTFRNGRKKWCGNSKSRGGCYKCLNYGDEPNSRYIYGCSHKHQRFAGWRAYFRYVYKSIFGRRRRRRRKYKFTSTTKNFPICSNPAGFRCAQDRNRKKRRYKRRRYYDRFSYIADPIENISTLEATPCDVSDTNRFKIEKGKYIKDLNLSISDYDIYNRNMFRKAQHLNNNTI